MFIIMALGYYLRRNDFFTDDAVKQINTLIFRLLIPIHMFRSCYQSDLRQAFQVRFILWCVAISIGGYALLALIVSRTLRSYQKQGALLQGMFRGNIVLMGLAVMEAVFGKEHTGLMAVSLAFLVPLYNVLAVLTLEMFRGGKIQLGSTVREMIKNPLLLSCLLGVAANLIGISLPGVLVKSIDSLAPVATPIALLTLGASFHVESIQKDKALIVAGTIVKLIVWPLFAVVVGVIVGFRGVELGTIMILFSAPTAVTSFPMAEQMGADSDLAASLIVFTGILSCLTIFLWLFVLLQCRLI